MKTLFATLFCILISAQAFTQTPATTDAVSNPDKLREIGLRFGGLNGFGMTYRFGTPTALWRIDGFGLGSQLFTSKADSQSVSDFELNMTISIGREYRKEIAKNLQLRTGFQFGLSVGYDAENNPTGKASRFVLMPLVGGIIGANYVIKDRFVIGAEINPYLYYRFQSSGNSPSQLYQHGFGLNINNSATLSACIRF